MSTEDGFEHWRDTLARTRDCDATSVHAADFAARLRRTELGPVVLLRTSFPSARFRRDERRVRRAAGPELYHLTMVTSGVHALKRGEDQRETFGPGDLALIDSSHPYDTKVFGTVAGQPRVEGVGVDIPQSLLPVPPHRLHDLLGRRLSGRTGSGALLTEFLLGLDRQAACLGPAEAAGLGEVVVSLMTTWLAAEIGTGAVRPEQARRAALVESVRSYIRHHLHDPALTPTTVAAAHHISVSYLHRLFGQECRGETVAAWIRGRRLEKAHRELADPGLAELPIHAVAVRCGLPRADDFGRAFKAAYGLSPREHRIGALRSAGGE
ncbi:helix-turn-helix domain-containing protein [Kitasatospora sp. NPDC056327]|uniref:helix-turn-helix domain-containing protein n=1 Tax=Kitasatospora sp. NPDC056327 TaxID=3345785 RepID=UPI0035DAF01D